MKINIRVRYCDVDRMDVVYYGKYFDYIEWARTEFLRAKGISNKEVESLGIGLPVNSLTASYKCPARYDDLLSIHTHLISFKGIRVILGYKIYLEEQNKLVFQAETTHIVVDLKTLRPTKLPESLANIFNN